MSQIKIEPFSLSALEHIAKVIGDRYTGSEITEYFRKAGFQQVRHDGTTKWRFVYSALEQIQITPYGPYHVAKLIQQLCDPQEYFGNAEGHRKIVHEVNEILNFYGLAVNTTNGKIMVSDKIDACLYSRESEEAKLFDSRDFHSEVKKQDVFCFLKAAIFILFLNVAKPLTNMCVKNPKLTSTDLI